MVQPSNASRVHIRSPDLVIAKYYVLASNSNAIRKDNSLYRDMILANNSLPINDLKQIFHWSDFISMCYKARVGVGIKFSYYIYDKISITDDAYKRTTPFFPIGRVGLS